MFLQDRWQQLKGVVINLKKQPIFNGKQVQMPTASPDEDDRYKRNRTAPIDPRGPIQGQVVQEDDDKPREGYDPNYAMSKDYHQQVLQSYGVHETSSHDTLMKWWVLGSGIVLTIVLWVVLGWGNAQLYSSFLPLSAAMGFVIMMYVAGFAYEAGTLALIFVSALSWRKKSRVPAVIAMLFAVLLSLFSFATQWYYVAVEVTHYHFDIPAQVLASLPVPLDIKWLILFRAAVPTIMTFCLVFIIPERKPDVKETIKQRMEEQKAIHELEEANEQAYQLGIARNTANTMMRNISDGMSQIASMYATTQNTMIQELQPRVLVQRVHPPEEIEAPKQVVRKPAPTPLRPQNNGVTQARQPNTQSSQNTPDLSLDVPQNVFNMNTTVFPKSDAEKLAFALTQVKSNPNITNQELAAKMGLSGSPSAAGFWKAKAQEEIRLSKLQDRQSPVPPVKVQSLSGIDLSTFQTGHIIDVAEADDSLDDGHFLTVDKWIGG